MKNSVVQFLLSLLRKHGNAVLGFAKKAINAICSFLGIAKDMIKPIVNRLLAFVLSKVSSTKRKAKSSFESLRRMAEEAIAQKRARSTSDTPKDETTADDTAESTNDSAVATSEETPTPLDMAQGPEDPEAPECTDEGEPAIAEAIESQPLTTSEASKSSDGAEDPQVTPAEPAAAQPKASEPKEPSKRPRSPILAEPSVTPEASRRPKSTIGTGVRRPSLAASSRAKAHENADPVPSEMAFLAPVIGRALLDAWDRRRALRSGSTSTAGRPL